MRPEPPASFPAVPRYLHQRRQQILQSAPGHRFGPYFADWHEAHLKVDGERLQTFKENKTRALETVTSLASETLRLIDSLCRRQRVAAAQRETHVLDLVSTSPLVTGLGQEHPVENGFAFLTPYGVPYLPGSGVKGAFRRAAETMCLLEEMDFLEAWWLFGFDSNAECVEAASKSDPDSALLSDFYAAVAGPEIRREFGTDAPAFLRALPRWRRHVHLEGLLRFWDCYPRCERLDVDTLTPHYGDYYEGKTSPHDSGQPTPNPFLVLPPGTRFGLVIEFQSRPASPELAWRNLLERIQEEALFQGIGGKTSVGYGQLRLQ